VASRGRAAYDAKEALSIMTSTDKKARVRERMGATGENYTTALRAIDAQSPRSSFYHAESVSGDPYVLIANSLEEALDIARQHNIRVDHSWREKHSQGNSSDHLVRIAKQPAERPVLWIGRQSFTTKRDFLDGDDCVTVT
jgi:hypothetical protein